MKISLHLLICLAGSALLTSCTTITVDAPQPAELSLGRGARVSIVPEAGSDAGEIVHSLFQLFAGQGYYQLLVDRKSLLALRGVGPEFEAGSGSFHARPLPDRALRVKLPPFCGLGRAPNHKMAGSAGGRAGIRASGAHLAAGGIVSFPQTPVRGRSRGMDRRARVRSPALRVWAGRGRHRPSRRLPTIRDGVGCVR